MNQRWQAVVVKESFQRVEASHQFICGRQSDRVDNRMVANDIDANDIVGR